MSIPAAALRLMADKGLSAIDIAEIAEAIECGAPKSSGAVRQQRYRDNKRNAGDVTRYATDDVTIAPPPTSPDKSPLEPQKLTPPPTPTRGESRACKGSRIPIDWHPEKPLPTEVASLVAQWPPGREQRELEGFRDYWISRQRDAARSDWDRTWWNRIRDQHDRIVRENRNGSYPNRPPRGDRTLAALASILPDMGGGADERHDPGGYAEGPFLVAHRSGRG